MNQGETHMPVAERQDRTSREDRFRRALRDQLVARIEEQLGIDEFAKAVDMLPTGAQALLSRRDWTLRTCLHVADSLGVDVRPSLEHHDSQDS
jgi:hypothetical protein